MKRKATRLTLLVLAAVLVLSLATPAFAAKKQFSDYCAIGDSVATGYGPLDGYSWEGHYFTVCDKAYPGLVRDALGANYHSLTTVASRLVDYLWMLNVIDDDKYDYAESVRYHGQGYVDELASMRGGAAEARIRKSSLITIALGNMDVFIYPRNSSVVDGEFDIGTFMKKALAGYTSYITDYPKLIKRIKQINPTAKILLLGQFNPFDCCEYTGVAGKAVDAFMKTMICNLNTNLKAIALTNGCTYVDITAVKDTFDPIEVPDSAIADVLGGHENHPDAEGHRIIAEAILSALPEAWKQVALPREGICRLELDGMEAGSYTLRKKGLTGWTIRTLDGLYVNLDERTGAITYDSVSRTTWSFLGGFHASVVKPVTLKLLFSSVTVNEKKTVYLNADKNGNLFTSTGITRTKLFIAN